MMMMVVVMIIDHPDAIKKIRTTIRVGVPICLLAYSRPLGYFLSAGFYLLLSVVSNIIIDICM